MLAGLLFGALQAGGVHMQAPHRHAVELVSIIEPIIVLFIAAPAADPAASSGSGGAPAGVGQQLAKGWNG